MKKLFFVIAGAIAMASCSDADETASAGSPTSSGSPVSQDTQQVTEPITAQQQDTVASTIATDASKTTIQWLDGVDRDFGKINEGQTLDVSFRFKNNGTKPLVISRVWAQCGCTIPETPQKPYAPGETGVIKASFSSAGRRGVNTKEVYLTANSDPETTTLKFHVEVKPKS